MCATRPIENWLPISEISYDLPPGEYHTVNEYCSNRMLLAMHAVKDAKDARRGSILANAVARMRDCEAGWWYALHTNRHRPKKVLKAMEMLYA